VKLAIRSNTYWNKLAFGRVYLIAAVTYDYLEFGASLVQINLYRARRSKMDNDRWLRNCKDAIYYTG